VIDGEHHQTFAGYNDILSFDARKAEYSPEELEKRAKAERLAKEMALRSCVDLCVCVDGWVGVERRSLFLQARKSVLILIACFCLVVSLMFFVFVSLFYVTDKKRCGIWSG
jgi:hypothetical protein